MALDKVHILGMSPSNSTFLTVKEYESKEVTPPIEIVLEGAHASCVAVTRGVMAARYDDEELRQIGEGSSMLGLKKVIGEIAMNGNLEHGAIKPLHPNIIEVEAVAYSALHTTVRELPA